MLSIAVDVQGAEVVRPYVVKFGVTFPVAVDQADTFGRAFGLKAIPVSFLVDEVGIVRLRGGGPTDGFLEEVRTVLREPLTRVRGAAPQPAESKSLEELETVVRRADAGGAARLALAERYSELGRVAEAEVQFGLAAQDFPDDPRVLFTWGMALLREGRREAALAKLRAARDEDPQNWRIRKQIWAIEHPEKFYTGESPDYGWQRGEMEREGQR